MDINCLKKSIHDGMNFNKGQGSSRIIKVTDDGFIYTIGNNGNKKKIVFEEVKKAIKEVETAGSINRKWYINCFPKEQVITLAILPT